MALTSCKFEDERGVADVLAMAIMFFLVIFAGMALHVLTLQPLNAATDRQLSLKSQHLYKALDLAYLDPYAVSYLRAASENLVLAQPTVPSDYLRLAMENALGYLRPDGYAAMVTLTYGDESLQVRAPGDAGSPGWRAFTYEGSISIVRAEAGENRIVLVQASVALWREGG